MHINAFRFVVTQRNNDQKLTAERGATFTNRFWVNHWRRLLLTSWMCGELINEEVEPNFPIPHKETLYQAVNFQVPSDKLDEIAAFHGSVIINRTRGERSAFCDEEPANFLTLNLAQDIAVG